MNGLSKYLYSIGERHVKFAARGFKPEYWDIFQDAIEYSLTDHIGSLEDFDEKQKADAIAAWRKLALYVITHLKRGFNDLMAKENHHKH
uniref:Globin family profile domain-containing protein n=1 Tax=Acrobeloides nanus TaxID=290746 RepID=A0A914E7U4_9BILA